MAEVIVGQPRVVLIVEDDSLIASDTADEFRSAGWDVREARTADAAIRFLDDGTAFDSLFTDIDLGGTLSGWDVAHAFRTRSPALAVAYASGLPRTHERAVHGSYFFMKPYQCTDVIAALGTPPKRPS